MAGKKQVEKQSEPQAMGVMMVAIDLLLSIVSSVFKNSWRQNPKGPKEKRRQKEPTIDRRLFLHLC